MVDFNRFDGDVLKDKNEERVTSVEKFESRSWDRDNVEQRLQEVQSNADTIETILQDINEQLDSLPSEEDLEEQWKPFLERQSTDNQGNPKRLPRAFYDAERERYSLMLRQAIWQARLRELEHFTRKKLGEKFSELLDDFRVLKSESNMQDILEVQDKVSRMETMLNQIEKMGQSFREDKRSLWNMMERVSQEDTNSLSRDEVEDAMAEGLDRFVKSNGVFTVDEEELQQDRENVEREDAADSAASSVVEEKKSGESSDDDAGDESMSEAEKREELVDNWDEYYSMKNQEDIAAELDMSQPWVSKIKKEEELD